VHDRRPSFLGADDLDQVAQEANASGVAEGAEYMRLLRSRDVRDQMTILGLHFDGEA
jgi:hypothetical protein